MKTGVTTIEILELEEALEEAREQLQEVAAPIEERIGELKSRLDALKDRQRGKIYKCQNCYAPIYKDGPYWRSVYSESAFCVNNRRHYIDPCKFIKNPESQLHPHYNRK